MHIHDGTKKPERIGAELSDAASRSSDNDVERATALEHCGLKDQFNFLFRDKLQQPAQARKGLEGKLE